MTADNSYDVKTEFQVNLEPVYIRFSSRYQKPYLLVGNSILGIAVEFARTAFHLYEDKRITFFCYQVYLLVPGMPIIVEYSIPFIEKIAGSKHLAFVSKKIMLCHRVVVSPFSPLR